MAATDQQVQQFVDQRVRPRVEQIRALLLAIEDDIAAIDDVYAALNVAEPTWTDQRNDGPPRLLSASDVLGIHAFNADLQAAIRAHGQLPIVLASCVRPVSQGVA